MPMLGTTTSRPATKGPRGLRYYGYEPNLLDQVADTFRQYGHDLAQEQIDCQKGFFTDTLRIDQPVALAHIDCDWYDSVMVCLERITPYLVRGGSLVIDDYDHWRGCGRAVDDYFAGREGEFVRVRRSRLQIFRR